jgi:hypothetical protein
MTTEEKTKAVTDLFEQAMKNYEQALKTGLKLQEESSKCWAGFLGQAPSPQEFQKRVKAMVDNVVPQTQKSIDDCLKLIEHNSRTNVELLRKAVAAAQATSVQEAQTKFLGFWEASLSALRDTAQSVTQANTKAVDAWVDFVRKSAEVPQTAAKA